MLWRGGHRSVSRALLTPSIASSGLGSGVSGVECGVWGVRCTVWDVGCLQPGCALRLSAWRSDCMGLGSRV
eukprot:368912-Rhodomonas_salina.2